MYSKLIRIPWITLHPVSAEINIKRVRVKEIFRLSWAVQTWVFGDINP